jgi:Polysulphide reductase, NrfD
MTERTQLTEAQLDALREEAARNGKVHGAGVSPSGSPFPRIAAAESYPGSPVLKPPTWTWQVPLYFFAGGVGGFSAVIALAAHLSGGNAELGRAALWIALAAALVSPPLLIADLGRPARFMNMLRVFKLQSTMSVGAWTLVVFSTGAGLAVVFRELILAGYDNVFFSVLGWAAEFLAAASGVVLASYTSVLLGVTAIPVWSENRRLLPLHFVIAGLGSAACLLELLGFMVPSTQLIALVAAAIETLIAASIELRGRYVDLPLREGSVGWMIRIAGIISGPLSLLVRIFSAHSSVGRTVAAVSFITGAVLSRFAWIAAGRESSRDSQALFQIQRESARNGRSVRSIGRH